MFGQHEKVKALVAPSSPASRLQPRGDGAGWCMSWETAIQPSITMNNTLWLCGKGVHYHRWGCKLLSVGHTDICWHAGCGWCKAQHAKKGFSCKAVQASRCRKPSATVCCCQCVNGCGQGTGQQPTLQVHVPMCYNSLHHWSSQPGGHHRL